MPILYQAEWCPFSSAVREALTELGIDYTIRQVPPAREDRDELKALAGTDAIPVFQAEDGELHRGWRAIFRHLRERDPWQYAAPHRRQFAAHADARESDVPGRLIEYFRGTGELEAAQEEQAAEPEVTDVPDRSRYELRLGGKLIGLAAYRRRPGGIVFTHTEVDESCEGRGYGTLVIRTALDAARAEGLQVVPLCPFVARVIERHPEYEDLLSRPA
jgi:predicted GNAT family acetyltransferase/glutaredoxin